MQPAKTIFLDGDSLQLIELEAIARGDAQVDLTPAAWERLRRARNLVDVIAAGDKPAYGINTGFGTLAEVRIAKSDLKQLQRNLILSHAAGVGEPLPRLEARALMVLREPDPAARAEERSGRPYEEVRARWLELSDVVLGLADEARALAHLVA